jgi:predicted RNase H-like nuclease (RuvC/YqgF family)
VKFISGECRPLMIASDVFPPPKLLEKVAAAFSAELHAPSENFPRSAKSRLVKPFSLSERHRHAKDALAAALMAYESRHPVIKRIEKRLSENGLSGKIEVGDVAVKIFSRECNNISSAIDKIEKEIN